VLPALGALGGGPTSGALKQGFAVISSDAGHTSGTDGVLRQRRAGPLDDGYQAVLKLRPMAKAMIAAAYGRGPDRSYIGAAPTAAATQWSPPRA
jgi:hypothetical protein